MPVLSEVEELRTNGLISLSIRKEELIMALYAFDGSGMKTRRAINGSGNIIRMGSGTLLRGSRL